MTAGLYTAAQGKQGNSGDVLRDNEVVFKVVVLCTEPTCIIKASQLFATI
jgi:hypothetical protein